MTRAPLWKEGGSSPAARNSSSAARQASPHQSAAKCCQPSDRTAAARPAAGRLAWLDLYRGLAILVMIEAHVCNSFLATNRWLPEWRTSLNYLNGLVAPAFLFIAGYAHGLSRSRNWPAPARPRLARLAAIAAIGYALHFPWTELAGHRWMDALRIGTRMDILPCLAGAIAALIMIECVGTRCVKPLVALLIGAILCAAPFGSKWMLGPVPLVAMVNENTGSLFPLLPWAAFALTGYLLSKRAPAPIAFAVPALVASAAALVLGHADHSRTSPAFFFERLSWILILVPVCRGLASKWTPPLVLLAGRESLAMYVAHLLLVPPLLSLGLPRAGLGPALVVLAGILVATFVSAWGLRRLREGRAARS